MEVLVGLLGDLERAFAAWIYPNRVLIGIVTTLLLAGLAIVAWRRRWDRVARRHPGQTVVGIALLIAIGGPIGWYLGSPLFLSSTMDESPPVVAGRASPAASQPASGSPTTPDPSISGFSTPSLGIPERTGSFTSTDEFHFGEGTAQLVETAPGIYTVRLEDFAVRNGPDLYVYLSPSAVGDVEDAVELGRLKADRGNQNYKVPAGTDVSLARSVVIWCKQFSVEFAAAPLR